MIADRLRAAANPAGRAAAWSVVLLSAVALAGCSGMSGSGTASDDGAPADPTAAAEQFTPAADPRPWPDGASAETPECQDVSAAALAAVNATIDNPVPGQADSVSWLSASPDPDEAVWFLSGVIESEGDSESYAVAWATTADPLQPYFAGTVRAIGGTTAYLSSALPLQLVNASPDGGLPPAALACIAQRPSG